MSVRLTANSSTLEINAEARIVSDPFEKQFASELLAAELGRLEAAITANQPGSPDLASLRKRISTHVYRVVGLFASFIFPSGLGILASTFALATLGMSQAAASMSGAGVFLVLTGACLVVWARQKKVR